MKKTSPSALSIPSFSEWKMTEFRLIEFLTRLWRYKTA